MRKTRNVFLAGVILMFILLSVSCSKKNESLMVYAAPKGDLMALSHLRNDALTPMEQLGKYIYFDKISTPNSMACSDCHAPREGFTGPMAGINIHGSVYRGANAHMFGNRKPPSSAYATLSPVLHYEEEDGNIVFVGGNFWDGRATGERMFTLYPDILVSGWPSAEQAQGPFLNPAEHNVADMQTVLMKIAQSKYVSMWVDVWGEPLEYSTDDDIEKNYDRVGLSIAAFEASSEVNQFTSKYDYYLKGNVELTEQETQGLLLFEGKGKCSLCHISDGDKPLFTDFTYDNLGVPKNPENPVYDDNPLFIDEGLGGYLATRVDSWSDYADENMGKQKVPTLRNVDKKPGLGFTKAYMHNGVFKSLKEVVHFYNTRDVETWPEPEVSETVNHDELGNLGLTNEEEDAIVAFMCTLSDGYVPR
jgi:cytochrome c peroxidase